MEKNVARILILEDDAYFRKILEAICGEIGETFAAGDIKTALGLIAKYSFQLLLLDWHLNPPDVSNLYASIENFQANTPRIALFTVPDLPNVVAAMKSGAFDILWAGQDKGAMKEKIKDSLARPQPRVYEHSYVSRLAESLTERAIAERTKFFQARREFSKTFLQQILSQQKFRRTQLAYMMGISPRTLHRHLAG